MKQVIIVESAFVDGMFYGAGSRLQVPINIAAILVETGRAKLLGDGDFVRSPPAGTAMAVPEAERAVAPPAISKKRIRSIGQ